MEENKAVNNELIEVQEELGKLDRNYFHTCTKVDENSNIKWYVYYKNMNDEDYLKISNRPILNSINNDLKDIEKLNEKFEKIKEKATSNIFIERFDLSFDIFETQNRINDELLKMFEIPGYSIMALIIFLFILNMETKIFAAVGMSLLTVYAILSLVINYIRDNVDKYIDELHKKEEERILKVYLKDKDMRGLKYEFAKKNRTKFIKENKEYRSKRQRLQPSMERLEGIQKTENE